MIKGNHDDCNKDVKDEKRYNENANALLFRAPWADKPSPCVSSLSFDTQPMSTRNNWQWKCYFCWFIQRDLLFHYHHSIIIFIIVSYQLYLLFSIKMISLFEWSSPLFCTQDALKWLTGCQRMRHLQKGRICATKTSSFAYCS